jgi:integrase
MNVLRERGSLSVRAIEFTILTAARTGEVISAEWADINLRDRVWTVPAQKMKGGKPHRVPLCGRAAEILRTLPHKSERPFALHETAMAKALVYGAAVAAVMGKAKILNLVVDQPPNSSVDFSSANNMQDIGRKLLQSIGLASPSELDIAEAIEANDVMVAALEAIRDRAQGTLDVV